MTTIWKFCLIFIVFYLTLTLFSGCTTEKTVQAQAFSGNGYPWSAQAVITEESMQNEELVIFFRYLGKLDEPLFDFHGKLCFAFGTSSQTVALTYDQEQGLIVPTELQFSIANPQLNKCAIIRISDTDYEVHFPTTKENLKAIRNENTSMLIEVDGNTHCSFDLKKQAASLK